MSAAAHVAETGFKVVGKRIPIIGAVITFGFALNETYNAVKEKGWAAGAAALTAGIAETGGNILGFGVGDAARQVTVEGIDLVSDQRPEDSFVFTVGKMGYEYINDDAPQNIIENNTAQTIAEVQTQEQNIGDNEMGIGTGLLKGSAAAVGKGASEATTAVVRTTATVGTLGVGGYVAGGMAVDAAGELIDETVADIKNSASEMMDSASEKGGIVSGLLGEGTDVLLEEVTGISEEDRKKNGGLWGAITSKFEGGGLIGSIMDMTEGKGGMIGAAVAAVTAIASGGGLLGIIATIATVALVASNWDDISQGFSNLVNPDKNTTVASKEQAEVQVGKGLEKELAGAPTTEQQADMVLPVPDIAEQKAIVEKFAATQIGQEAMAKALGDDGEMGVNEAERILIENKALAATGISAGELTKHTNDYADNNPELVAGYREQYDKEIGSKVQESNIDLAGLGAAIGSQEVQKGIISEEKAQESQMGIPG
jgi:hypothetical protein